MRLFLFGLALVFIQPASAQSPDVASPFVNKKRLKFVIVFSSVAYVGATAMLNEVWYSQSSRSSFHFFNDIQEWKQMDKVGHIFSAFQLSSIGSKAFRWSGLSENKSDRIGAISSFGIMASIEILDGFSSAYGASLTDLSANALGIGLYYAQKALWQEIRIYPKFSFHRTSFASLRPNSLGSNLPEQIIKDYNGQTEWISFDMDKFSRFPKWLNLAVGYGVDGMIYANNQANFQTGLTPKRQFYVALDFDLNAFHSKSKLINTIIYFVNMIKLPAPALEFSSGGIKGHYLYF